MATEQSVPRHRRGHGRVTLEDVAQVAGVTSITVSRYLREPALVALETAERVRTALRETGYVPNKQAGQLASGRSNLVAAIVADMAQSDCAHAVQGLSDALQDAGFELLLASTRRSAEREEDLLRALLGWFPTAVIVTGREHTYGALKLLRSARAAGTPVIELWRHAADGADGFTPVGFDHDAIGRAMAEHLLSRGHTRLALVDGDPRDGDGAAARRAGFDAAAAAGGASVTHLRVETDDDAFAAGRRALIALQNSHSPVTAAAFASDALACGALLEAQSRGIGVPQRLALLGCGDDAVARHMAPALSTVALPCDDVGRQAANALLAALRGEAPGNTALAWQLIPRGST